MDDKEKMLYDSVVTFLKDNKSLQDCFRYIETASCGCCGTGLFFNQGSIYTAPGSYQLVSSAGRFDTHTLAEDTRILGLDLLFDIDDANLIRIRNIVFQVLEDKKVNFIPLSHSAFYSATRFVTGQKFELVERVGWECVFALDTPAETEKRYFISGYDKNEDPPLYFLARLPHKVSTYAEGIAALKPESVKIAEKKGLKVLRQGDMFAIPTRYSENDLKKMKANFNHKPLYGTGHFCEYVATLPDGTMFGRESMYHAPANRRPDHAKLKLVVSHGTGYRMPWFLIVKNTVPIQERR